VVELLVDHGRAAVALDVVAEVAERTEGMEDYLYSLRLWLLSEAGRIDEAIAEASAQADDKFGYRADALARPLEKAGRTDEAIAVLAELPTGIGSTDLARLLIQQGRVDEAIAVHRPTQSNPDLSDRA
jgi:hypothetical protein